MTTKMPSAPERRETRAIPTGGPASVRECRAAAGAVLITKAAPALRFAAELAAALLIVAAWLLVFGAGQREVCVRVGVALVLGGNCP